ncbi:MAG TPA: hypothetical protein VF665_06925 [Longimicrobium sp.]|jgi:hypothetical protein|uniref:hypothetical protein n=1 Tax=Longimicrobium sp. TaxID=2029185 RepID=UPI002ED80DD8
MTDSQPEAPRGPRTGERRGTDRRKTDRRDPVPFWRRPIALVGYGVLGALALVVLLGGLRGGGDDGVARDEKLSSSTAAAEPAVEEDPVRQPARAPADAYGQAGYERLTVEGQASIGRLVNTELYCESPRSFTIVSGDTVRRALGDLIQEGMIPAAECKWGSSRDAQREDFLLIVPPRHARDFASTPVVNDAFVERHRVFAVVEWIGPTQALALRPAGIMRGIARR